jgi:ABC-2 type transport system permease protein
VRGALARTLRVAQVELLGQLRLPLTWLVWGLFLLVSGESLWAVLELASGSGLSTGEVLRLFFGGTLLYWLIQLLVGALLPMRLFAEERRRGTLEGLLSLPVAPGEWVVGRYLGVLALAVLEWLSLIALLAGLGQGLWGAPRLDPGVLAAASLGTLLVTASLLALGTLASAVTSSQLGAALLTCTLGASFVLLCAVGEGTRPPTGGAPLGPVAQLDELTRGLVSLSTGALHAVTVTLLLWGATRAVARGRALSRSRRVDEALVGVVLGGLCLLLVRHPLRSDWTRDGRLTLSAATVSLLSSLERPVEVVLWPPARSPDSTALGVVRALLGQYAQRAPLLGVEQLDPDRDRARLQLLGQRHGLSAHDLDAGGILFSTGIDAGQSRLIPGSEWDRVQSNPARRHGQWDRLLGSALAEVHRARAPMICLAVGAAAAPTDDAPPSMSAIERLLRGRGLLPRRVALGDGQAAPFGGCDVAAWGEGDEPLGGEARVQLERFVDGGGRLLLLLGPAFERSLGGLRPSGLERWLEGRGIVVEPRLVVDEVHLPEGGAHLWAESAEGGHPLARAAAGQRLPWSLSQVVRPLEGSAAASILRSSPTSWSTTDLLQAVLPAPRSFDALHDVRGPLSLAVAQSSASGAPQLVVLGSSQVLRDPHLLEATRPLLLDSLDWLLGEALRDGASPLAPADVPMRIDRRTAERLSWLLLVGAPLGPLAVALALLLRRRGA